ncbi:MAG: phosphate ABC transporter permease subunit PstC [Chloroflexota bacterium]
MNDRMRQGVTGVATARVETPEAQGIARPERGPVRFAALEAIEAQARPEQQTRREPHALSTPSNIGDRLFNGLTAGFAGFIVVILGLMIAVLLWQSRTAVSTYGVTFLTNSAWNPVLNNFGAAPSILGTLYTSALALLIGAPIAIMVAIFLAELAPRPIRFPLGFVVELLAAVPSIVFGLWALFVLVPLVRQYIEPGLIDHFGNTPLFSGPPLGLGFLTASVILAVMILPTIAAISRDVMLAVPNTQRDAMLALGATRWETIWKVVVPAARSGIVGGVILGLGRALGETMAVQLVIGNNLQSFNASLVGQGTTITATLVNQFSEATSDLYRASLIELALILLMVTVALNVVARLLVWRVAR